MQAYNKKGNMGLEFVIAVTLFLMAFWFIYLQSTFLLLPKTMRNDVRQPGADFVASKLVMDPGYKSGAPTPEDWDNVTGYDDLGFALYDLGTKANVLDRDKLDAVNGTACNTLKMSVFKGDFAYEVESNHKWSCVASFTKDAFVQRAVYVKSGGAYWDGVIKVWVA
jgi:hypothetical protein